MEFVNNAYFWQKIDTLYLISDFVITRKKNDVHPIYTNLIYPVDYGYLKDTSAGEEHIACYKGTNKNDSVEAIVVCCDILKKDIEVKLLASCTKEEENSILNFLNQTDFQKTIIFYRGVNTPEWAAKE